MNHNNHNFFVILGKSIASSPQKRWLGKLNFVPVNKKALDVLLTVMV